jgi:hypothetical protein
MGEKRYAGLTPFTAETAPHSGRRKGARNKLAYSFVQALQSDFEKYGEEVIRVVRIEKPAEYLKVIASILPKELEISDGGRLKELSDEQLDSIIEFINGRLAERAGKPDRREDQTLN